MLAAAFLSACGLSPSGQLPDQISATKWARDIELCDKDYVRFESNEIVTYRDNRELFKFPIVKSMRVDERRAMVEIAPPETQDSLMGRPDNNVLLEFEIDANADRKRMSLRAEGTIEKLTKARPGFGLYDLFNLVACPI